VCVPAGNRIAISHVPTRWHSHYTKLPCSYLFTSLTVTLAEDHYRHGQWRGQVHNTDRETSFAQRSVYCLRLKRTSVTLQHQQCPYHWAKHWRKHGSRSLTKMSRRQRGGKDMGLRMRVSGQHHAPAALPPRKRSGIPCMVVCENI
jgi:hypothetical protein